MIVGVTMVRDECDVIGTVLRHMATQVDALVVLDNRSVDGTTEIIRQVAEESMDFCPIAVKRDDTVGYEQSRKMTKAAHYAGRTYGATWIVPFDADEIWYSPFRRIGDFLESRPDDEMIVPAVLYDHVATGEDDPTIDNPILRLKWRRDYPAALPKVACRYTGNLIVGMGNHEAWYDNTTSKAKVSEHRLAIRHFPYRSAEQVIRKIRNGAEAYAATNLPENYGAHWRGWGKILDAQGPEAIAELFHKWHWREHPGVKLTIDGEIQPSLRFDPVSDLPIAAAPEGHPGSAHQD